MANLDHVNIDGTQYDILDAGAYRKPNGGIPKTDLASGVQSSLQKADDTAELVPAQASPSNQLADKDFVNSTVSTATATFRGTYNLITDLSLTTSATHEQIGNALNTAIPTKDNNDYAYVQIPTSGATPTEIARIDRYKYNGTSFVFEYSVNNSGFTAAQWAAINSGITSGKLTTIEEAIANMYTKTEVDTLIEDTPDFVEEEPSEEIEDEFERLLTALYQALTDVGVEITAAQQAAALAQAKATLANDAATSANTAASGANTQGTYAKNQGDYAKAQGDYAKAKGDEVEEARGTYQSLDARLDAIEANAEATDSEIETARGTFQSLDARLDDIEENAGDLEFVEDNTDDNPFV